jgi:gliding motility-associated-like protein
MKKIAILFLIKMVAIAHCFAQIENDLLIHYNLEDNFIDESPNGFDGTPVDITFTTGQFGGAQSAILLNGVSSRVDFPNVSELEPDFPISFSTRVRFDEISGEQIVFATDFSETTHSGAWLQITSAGLVSANFGNAQGGFIGSTRHGKAIDFEVQVGQWYCISLIIRGFQDMDIYVDGVSYPGNYNGTANFMAYTDGTGNLGMKAANPVTAIPPYFFNGAIDDFWFWEREITEEEILNVCEESSPCLGNLSLDETSLCSGEEAEFSFSLEENDSNIQTVLWEFENGISSSDEIPSITFTQEGTQSYDLTVITADGCVYTASSTVEVAPTLDPPDVETSVTLCPGETFTINTEDYPEWELTNSEGIVFNQIEFVAAGDYLLIFQSECGNYDVEIAVDFVDLTNDAFGDFQTICPISADTVEIGFANGVHFYLWENGSTENSIEVSEPGLYSVTITSPSTGCSTEYAFNILESLFAPADIFDTPELEICEEGQRNINFPPEYGPYTFPNDSVGFTYFAFESEELVFTYSDGCFSYNASIDIFVEPCLCPVWIPNVFSPDGDGLNDVFRPVLDCPIYDYTMRIYNRWGSEIFLTRDYNNPWRGESPDTEYYAHDGVYFYLVTLFQDLDGLRVPSEFQGTVTLLR